MLSRKILDFSKSHWAFLIGLVLTLALLWPLFAAPYFNIQDDVQNIRLYEMDKCVKDLQLPCRWVPDLGGEYGYPLFEYYAPLPYYVGELFYLPTSNLLFSTKVMFGLSFVLSFVFMYLLARKFWGNTGGAVTAIFYSYAPYHAVDFYVRGAMGEMWAMAFFPAILWAIVKLKEKTNLSNTVLTGFFFACLILSHNLSAMIFLPIMIVFALILFFQRKEKKFLGLFVASLALGFLLSGFYFLPALVEKPLAHVETTIEGYFFYTEHFKGLQKLFVDRYWGYGPSLREIPGKVEDNTFPYQIGIAHWVLWLGSLVGAFLLWKKKRAKSVLILFFTFVVFGSIFMINPKSAFVWSKLPPLWYLQFPWRFLELVILFISLCVGSLFILRIKERYKLILFAVLVALVVALNFSYFRPEKFVNETNADLLTGQKWDSQIKRSIFDYLPIYAKAPPAELATSRYQLLSGNGRIIDFKEGTNWMSFGSSAITPIEFQWSQYYFPDWEVFVDGKEVPIDYQRLIHGAGSQPIINDLGLITFNIPPGNHHITAHLYNSPVRVVGNGMTVVGILVSLFLLFSNRIRLGKSSFPEGRGFASFLRRQESN